MVNIIVNVKNVFNFIFGVNVIGYLVISFMNSEFINVVNVVVIKMVFWFIFIFFDMFLIFVKFKICGLIVKI